MNILSFGLFSGLEQLKNEHNDILNSLYQSLKMVKKDKGDSNVVEEKTGMIEKSLETLELGLGEAKVSSYLSPLLIFSSSQVYNPRYFCSPDTIYQTNQDTIKQPSR